MYPGRPSLTLGNTCASPLLTEQNICTVWVPVPFRPGCMQAILLWSQLVTSILLFSFAYISAMVHHFHDQFLRESVNEKSPW